MFLKSILPAVFITVCTSAFGQTLIEKADKQYELHAYRLAAKSYETILAQNQDKWAASLRLADCYLHLNELAKASNQYARAMRDGHTQAQDYLRYGRVLMMLGQYQAAEEQFRIYQKSDATVAIQFIKACEYARSNSEGASDYEVTPLSKINSSAAEFGPTIWKDQLIWSSTRNDFKRAQNNPNPNDLINGEANQLFIAPIEGVSRQAFKIHFLRTDLRNTFNESNPAFTADGKTVAFMRNNIAEDERITSDGGLEMSIYFADVDADGNWMNVRSFPYNSGSTGFPCFSPDGNTLYYASNRNGGYGGFDIYKSDKRGNMWTEPKNLGPTINSQGEEITPFFDGRTLFFASDWHFGFGGYDIFKTEGTNIVNLGTGVNSSGDDYGFVFTPSVSVGFFVSNRQGVKGKDDIYRVATTVGETANIVVLENGIPLKDAQVNVIQGNVSNLTKLNGGNFLVNLSDRKSLTIEVKKEGFKTKTVKIDPDYSNTSRIVEVAMGRDIPTQMSNIPEYSAILTDGSSGEPLEGVLVRLNNQTTQTQSETMTDVRGKLKFQMSPKDAYLLTFSKEGFIVAQQFVKASEQKTRYLGEFALKPSAVTNKIALSTTQAQADIPKPIQTTPNIPKDYSVRVIPSSIKKGSETTDVVEEKVSANLPKVYAIQIAVMKLNDVLNLGKFDDLKKEGNIYSVPENSVKKIRLGIFRTKEEAITAVKKAKQYGYNDSFIIEEKNEQAVAENMFVPNPTPIKTIPTASEMKVKAPQQQVFVPIPPKSAKETTPPAKDIPTTYSNIPVKKAPVVEDKTFKVKIATMTKPEWFDDSKVSHLWKIETIKKGEYTIFIMDGFKTLQEAKAMKKKVQASGYSDAKVIQKDGDDFKVVD